jgi:drug/metabolite transporter (DMT)-like permease
VNSSETKPTKGYLSVVVAAIMWASSGTAGKALFESGITPFELAQIRVTLSTALLAAAFLVFSRRLFRLRLRDLGYFLVLGGVGMALNNIAYFYAISKIQVAAAILLQYLAPILVAFYSICFWRERLTFPKLVALFLAFGGCYLVVGGYNLQLLEMNRLGIIGGLGAAISFAAYTLLGERGMHYYPPWTVHFYALAFAALTWHVLYTPLHYLTAGFTWAQWGYILHIAVVGTILPFGLYFVGINHIRSTRAIITANLEPISAGFMAFLALGEAIEALQMVGGAMVIGAISLLQLQRERDRLAPALIRSRDPSTKIPLSPLC